jgi:hypothetical protein
MARMSKAGVAAVLVALVVGWTIWPADASRLIRGFQDQEAESAIVEVASGPLGEPTLALTGRGDFTPESVVLFGFVSAIGGLGDADLFAGETQGEETARFTFVADLAVDSVTNQADVTITAASGQMRVFLNEAAGAAWSDRASFATGRVVAEYSLDLRETLHRQAPGIGLAVGTGKLIQTVSEEFALGDERFRFGFIDLEQGLRYVGAIMPGTESGLADVVGFTGKMAVTGRESTVVILGDPDAAAAPATPASGTDLCSQLEPWLTETTERLAQAGNLEAATAADATLESLDGGALRRAADQVNSLVTAQRESAVPSEAAPTNRLTVTALSTYARGLQAVADAAEAQDADLLAQGQTALRDGSNLLARAAEAVNAVAPECAVEAA